MKLLFALAALLVMEPAPPPTLERTGVDYKYNDRGRAVALTERYTVRWKGDGGGEPDSVFFNASATGQAQQALKFSPALLDRVVSITWAAPAIGQSITTQGCARIHRRGIYAPAVGFVCSSSRTYSTPDSLPAPTVDTTLLVMRQIIEPRNVALTITQADNIGVPATRQQFCLFYMFRDGKVPVDNSASLYCMGQYSTWFTLSQRSTSAKQVARGDSLYHGLLLANGKRGNGVPVRVAISASR